jgi:hypothetical protein
MRQTATQESKVIKRMIARKEDLQFTFGLAEMRMEMHAEKSAVHMASPKPGNFCTEVLCLTPRPLGHETGMYNSLSSFTTA